MNLILQLGIAAGVLQLVGFAIYNWQMFRGLTKPNMVTWTLWAYLTVLNSSSYAVMTTDLAKSILPIASALATLGTFAYSLFIGKFERLDRWNCLVLAIGVVAGLVWLWFRSATYANIIVVGAVAIAFVPLYRGVWRKPAVEKALAWYIWASAYSVLTYIVFVRWSGQYLDLVYPVSMLFLHLAVGLLSHRQPRACSVTQTREEV